MEKRRSGRGGRGRNPRNVFSPEAPVTMAGTQPARFARVAPRRQGGATKPAAGAGRQGRGVGGLVVGIITWKYEEGDSDQGIRT